MTALVALLGGWRATVFAALLVAVSVLAGWQALRWKAHTAADESATARSATKAALTAASWRQSVYDISLNAYQRDRTYAADTTRLSAELADGTRRLRDRFRCPVPRTPAGPALGGGDTPGGREQPGGLQESDLRVADGIGRDADAVAVAYADCRATLVTIGVLPK